MVKILKRAAAYILIVFIIAGIADTSVYATEVDVTDTQGGDAADTTVTEPVSAPSYPDYNSNTLTPVNAIDLSLHSETTGEFTNVYSYKNPFMGKDTSKGIILEFNAKPTWEVHVLGAIFAFTGTGNYDGKFYFTPGSYLGYNCENYGGYFDANLYNYAIVKDYIRDGAKIRIEVTPTGFAVYSDDELCYDQTILSDESRAAYSIKDIENFSNVLEWIAGADTLHFGYGSWWNTTNGNEANIILSDVVFKLADGTVVMDELRVNKELLESLGGSINLQIENKEPLSEIADIEVEIFDINSVEYEGTSLFPLMAGLVAAVLVIAVILVVLLTKKRTYNEI